MEMNTTHIAVEASGAMHLFTADADLIRLINAYVEAHQTIGNLIISITRRQSSQKGDYDYVLTSDIPNEHKAEVIAQLTAEG